MLLRSNTFVVRFISFSTFIGEGLGEGSQDRRAAGAEDASAPGKLSPVHYEYILLTAVFLTRNQDVRTMTGYTTSMYYCWYAALVDCCVSYAQPRCSDNDCIIYHGTFERIVLTISTSTFTGYDTTTIAVLLSSVFLTLSMLTYLQGVLVQQGGVCGSSRGFDRCICHAW